MPPAVLPSSSAPDKGTRVKVTGVVVQEEAGRTESASNAYIMELEGQQYADLHQKVQQGRLRR
jgi:hypothetical protein